MRREIALVAVIAAVCGLGICLATRGSYFFADDWLNLTQARQSGMSWDYLTLGYFGHFAPVHRVLDWVWATKLGGSWAAYLTVMLALYAVAVAAFYGLLRALRCNSPLAGAATTLFASSVVWVRVIQWPASAGHVVWALAATAVSLAAAMLWFERRSWPWIAVAAGAMAAGLLSYEKPVLVLLYVPMLRYFVLAPSLAPRAVWARLREDWPLLAALAVVAGVYAVIVMAGDYGKTSGHVSGADLAEFCGRGWIRGTGSLVIGQGSPEYAQPIPTALVVAAQLVLAALVVMSVARRRAAWRAWAFLLVCWVVNLGLIGIGRVGTFGPGVALDPRYNAEMALLLPLAVALAFAPGPARLASARPRGLVLVPAALAAVAALGVSTANAYRRVEHAWQGAGARQWVDRVRVEAPTLRGPDGRLSIVDAPAPFEVVAGAQPPYNLLSAVLPIVLDDVDFDGGGTPVVVEPDGTMRPTRGRRVWRAPGGCGPRSLQAAVDNRGHRARGRLTLDLAAPARRPLTIEAFADYGRGLEPLARAIRFVPGARRSGTFADLTGMSALRLRLPPGVCVRSVSTALLG